jgi:uncharacterized membrane protein
MLWYSTIVMSLLTFFAWWNGKQFKAQKESAGLGNALYVAAAFGAVGTVCFLVAALL